MWMDVQLNALSHASCQQSNTNIGDNKFLYTDKLCGASFNNSSEHLIGILINTLRQWENRAYSLYIHPPSKTPYTVAHVFIVAGHMPG